MPRPDTSNNPVRECTRCHREHQRKHTLCRGCVNEYRKNPDIPRRKAGRKPGFSTSGECSAPPPPPPGFDERDRERGRPLL